MELQQAKEERIKKRKVYSEENIKIAIKEYADRMSGRLWGYKLISVSDIKKINDTTCNAYGIMEKISFDFSKRDSMGLPKVVKKRFERWPGLLGQIEAIYK